MSELNVNKITEYTSGNGVEFQGYKETDVAVTSTSGVIAIDLANGNTGSITLSENITDIDFTNVPTNGTSSFTLKVTQDGTGTRTMAINAITVNGGGNVTGLTPGAAGLTLSTGAADIDLVSFLFFDAGTPLINLLLDFSQEVHMPLGATRFGFSAGVREVDVQYLVIAGGGGGGSNTTNFCGEGGGGAGAGGYRNSYASETSGGNSSTETPLTIGVGNSVTVTVGGAGTGGAANPTGASGTQGNSSVFSTITSTGGGYGGGYNATGGSGGSGGGAGAGGNSRSGGTATTDEGKNGGSNACSGGGGGGGASQSGANASTDTGGNGGNGLSSSITGSAVTRAGGGRGSGYTTNGSNGSGIRGANSGCGGVGNTLSAGGNGGSGVVILRYPNTFTITVGAGLTSSTATDGSDSVTTFTAGTGNVSWS